MAWPSSIYVVFMWSISHFQPHLHYNQSNNLIKTDTPEKSWSAFKNLYQHAKKSGYFIYLFWKYAWLKNHAIWLAANILGPYLMDKNFPKYEICAETNAVKINDQFFQKNSENPVFWPTFPIFGAKCFFQNNTFAHELIFQILISF